MDDLTRNVFSFMALFPGSTAFAWVHKGMVLNELDRKSVLKVLDEVRPYIVEMLSLEQLNMQCMQSSNSVSEFKSKLEQQEKKLDNSVLRTDLRIYLGRLRRKLNS
jgi:hypothetical protein